MEDAFGPHRFVIAIGISVGLVNFDRWKIIRSCAKLHWEGDETLWVGAGMTEHEEEGMKGDERLSKKTRVQWAE